jgi:hypothetical protein
VEPTVIVGEAVAGQSKQLRKKAEAIINVMETNQYDLGELLCRIQDEALYTQWGFNTYSEYMKTTKLKASKARYLPQIARVMKAIAVERAQYESIGISKLRVIASLNPTDVYTHPVSKEETSMHNFIAAIVDKALTDGEAYTLDEIKKHVRTLKGITGDRDITFLGIPILRAALDNVVRPCFDRFKMLIGTVATDSEGKAVDASDGTVLERICATVLALPDEYFNAPALAEEIDEEGSGDQGISEGQVEVQE